MHDAFEEVAKRYGPDYAHLLCVSNPLAAYMGKHMPPQLEPLNLYEEFKDKNWWQRMMEKWG
jgi:protein-tyrosine phosphatase